MSENTSSIETQRKLRIQKVEQLRELGIDPYPVYSKRDCTLAEVRDCFTDCKSKCSHITIAGRIKSKRGSGKISFVTLEDESNPEGFQVVVKSDSLPATIEERPEGSHGVTYKIFSKKIEVGDYIQATGKLDVTQAGENSLFATEVVLLSKSLRPLPDELDYENTEARYLDRVADFKMNTIDPESGMSVRDYVRAKETYWRIWREEMLKEGFTEVYGNIFESQPAGADAKTFTTYYNELEQEMHLRIALEIQLKKLIAGGFEKVFEIGRVFRNEGSSPMHLQEFTFIEWYWSYSNYYDAMPFIIRVYRRIAQELLGTLTQKTYGGDDINWGPWCSQEEADNNGWKLVDGWPAIPYFDAVRHFSKKYYSKGEVDLENKSYDELLAMAQEYGAEVEKGINISNLMDKIYKKVARPFMIHPFFLIDQPVELEPLAKRNPDNPKLVHRWQVVAGGAEHGKCFSELNDPLDQFDRLDAQQKAKDAGDEEAQSLDEEFVKAMEYGMPPMSGFGISDRLMSFMLGKHIREVATFPYVRDNKQNINKETKVFHVVLNSDESIPQWQKLNAIAHLTGSVIAHNLHKSDVIDIESVTTKDGVEFPMDLRWGIHIKETIKSADILEVFKQADNNPKVHTTVFGEDFFSAKNDEMAIENFSKKDSEDVKWIGVLVYGERKTVEKLTKQFPRFEK